MSRRCSALSKQWKSKINILQKNPHILCGFFIYQFFNYSSPKSSKRWVTWLDLWVSCLGWFSSTTFIIFVLLLVFFDNFRRDIKDRTNHANNNNQLIITHTFSNFTFIVIDSTLATLAQSITHIKALTIIHNKIKSTNGSSSRNEHNLVIKPLKDTLKFQQNKPTNAKKITIDDLHNTPENSILSQLSSALTTGNTKKQTVKATK